MYLDPLDREKVEHKIDAMSHVFNKYTNQKIQIGFSKPNSFQKKVLESKKAWVTHSAQWMKVASIDYLPFCFRRGLIFILISNFIIIYIIYNLDVS